MRKLFSTSLLMAFMVLSLSACKNSEKSDSDRIANDQGTTEASNEPFFKLSLAQWSLNPMISSGELDAMDFAQKASELGFEGIEYVTGYYSSMIKDADDPEAALQNVLEELKARSEEYNVENVLIMVDGEGSLASNSEEERNQAVENHKKWVDAAEFLGAHSIRVNLFGSTEPEEWKANATDGLRKLSEYAAQKNINVLVENHGQLSSHAGYLAEVMEEVNLPNCGTLPDFGNFCIRRESGAQWSGNCAEEYPIYQGIEEMMPYAKAVSAKSYDFDETGQETKLDYERILKMVKDAGYTGYVGVEYEGSRLSSEEGILATKELLIEEGSKLNK